MTTRDNEQMTERARKRLGKNAKRGLRGYPVATVALYGPDDTRATKLTVGIGRDWRRRRMTVGVAFVRRGIRELGELAEPIVDLDCATYRGSGSSGRP
jgi:hypothetical protein